MQELLRYRSANGIETFIVSGGDSDFMRVRTERGDHVLAVLGSSALFGHHVAVAPCQYRRFSTPSSRQNQMKSQVAIGSLGSAMKMSIGPLRQGTIRLSSIAVLAEGIVHLAVRRWTFASEASAGCRDIRTAAMTPRETSQTIAKAVMMRRILAGPSAAELPRNPIISLCNRCSRAPETTQNQASVG